MGGQSDDQLPEMRAPHGLALLRARGESAVTTNRNPYPMWDPHYNPEPEGRNPVPFMEPNWKSESKLGPTSWSKIAIELIRRMAGPATPGTDSDHHVLRGRHPALRFKKGHYVDAYRAVQHMSQAPRSAVGSTVHKERIREVRDWRGRQVSESSALRSYERWKSRAKDYGLERPDLYDFHHDRSEGWFALDLLGAQDVIWAVFGPPHPLEAQLPSSRWGTGEEREFALLEESLDRLEGAYAPNKIPAPAKRAWERQFEQHSLLYTTDAPLPRDTEINVSRYVRHYAIYPGVVRRREAAAQSRARFDAGQEAVRVAGRRPPTICPHCGPRRRDVGGKINHTFGCPLRRVAPKPFASCPGCGGSRCGHGYRHRPDCDLGRNAKRRLRRRDRQQDKANPPSRQLARQPSTEVVRADRARPPVPR